MAGTLYSLVREDFVRADYISAAVFGALAAFYALPGLIAVVLGRRRQWAVLTTNLLLGWTGVGWVTTLIWACSHDNIRRNTGRRGKRSFDDAEGFSNDNVGRPVAASTFSWDEASADDYAAWLSAGEGLTDGVSVPHRPERLIKVAA